MNFNINPGEIWQVQIFSPRCDVKTKERKIFVISNYRNLTCCNRLLSKLKKIQTKKNKLKYKILKKKILEGSQESKKKRLKKW